MQVIPAIDLLGNDAVRLEQGDYDRVLTRLPVESFVQTVLRRSPPLLHVVDLDGARAGCLRPEQLTRVIEAAAGTPIQVSGGIRSLDAATKALELGASRVVVGTAAFGEHGLLQSLVDQLGERLVVAIDCRDGRVALRGWLAQTELRIEEALERCVDFGVRRIMVTAIDRDGTMSGPDLDLLHKACSSPLSVLAAGGIRGDADIEAVGDLGCEGAIIGRALIEMMPSSV